MQENMWFEKLTKDNILGAVGFDKSREITEKSEQSEQPLRARKVE